MFGKAFRGKQSIDPDSRGLHARVACAKLRRTGRSQRGLGLTGLLLNVDVQHGLFRFLKSKLSGFYSFDRIHPASPELGEGRAD